MTGLCTRCVCALGFDGLGKRFFFCKALLTVGLIANFIEIWNICEQSDRSCCLLKVGICKILESLNDFVRFWKFLRARLLVAKLYKV